MLFRSKEAYAPNYLTQTFKPNYRQGSISTTRNLIKPTTCSIKQNISSFGYNVDCTSYVEEETIRKIRNMELYISKLKERINDFSKKRNEITRYIEDPKKFVELNNIIEDVQFNYSRLSKESIKEKYKESETFKEYMEITQENEKISTDFQSEISDQEVKIKLLNETLAKRTGKLDEFETKNKQLVNFPVIKASIDY